MDDAWASWRNTGEGMGGLAGAVIRGRSWFTMVRLCFQVAWYRARA